jgi:hypothetical protein
MRASMSSSDGRRHSPPDLGTAHPTHRVDRLARFSARPVVASPDRLVPGSLLWSSLRRIPLTKPLADVRVVRPRCDGEEGAAIRCPKGTKRARWSSAGRLVRV